MQAQVQVDEDEDLEMETELEFGEEVEERCIGWCKGNASGAVGSIGLIRIEPEYEIDRRKGGGGLSKGFVMYLTLGVCG